MCRDSRIVPGAAATEIELAKRVKDFSFLETGYFVFLLSYHFLNIKYICFLGEWGHTDVFTHTSFIRCLDVVISLPNYIWNLRIPLCHTDGTLFLLQV